MVHEATHVSGLISVVIEMENAKTVPGDEVSGTLVELARQLNEWTSTTASKAEVILAFPGKDAEANSLLELVGRVAPELPRVADLRAVGVPDGRYYELKNAGVADSRGQLIVLLDSDAMPEPGWLHELLAPLLDPTTVVVNGHTYLGHHDLVSRTLALVWVFPLRDRDVREAQRRSLNANNCAFRGDYIRRRPFPIDGGFKVGCTKLERQLRVDGVKVVRAPAFAQHAPLAGWRFLLWRGLVTGRDADRKYADLRSPSRLRRMAAACQRGLKAGARVLRRVLMLRRQVAMPLWEMPAALVLGLLFYGLAFGAQMKRALGWTPDETEIIPAFVEHH